LIFNSTVVIRRPTEVTLDASAHSCVGHGCSDTAVGYPAPSRKSLRSVQSSRGALGGVAPRARYWTARWL